ncbi:hypothetical protein BDQ12DRAFT_694091 [Crucibulum laeve]|uniref:F-box domain-containing protein n=1 Tax=Crucibulum laeve TaxID=68775 RepID=A0A5C3LED9_9AGAR|nr:hypothetical protein BDQ12DRAFT_694091 [Crucibulum laeve]
MHPCLQISEILTLICFEVYGSGDRKDKSDALSLVKTCRTFKEPALEVLWSRLGSILPLLMLLPGDLWTITRAPASGREKRPTFIFKRYPESADWLLFDKFATYVRVIGEFVAKWTMEPPQTVIDLEVYHLLEGRQNLLPNSQTVIFDSHVPYGRLYISARTRALEVLIHSEHFDSGMNICSLFGYASSAACFITHLSVGISGRRLGFGSGAILTDMENSLSRLICELRNLEVLKVASQLRLTHEAVGHILSLPNLRALNFSVPILQAMKDEIDISGYSRLLELRLHCNELGAPCFPELITSLNPFRLEEIKFTATNGRMSASDFHAVHAALRQKCSHEALKSIELSLTNSIHENTAQHTSSFEVLEPLLSFHNLTWISITGVSFNDLTDSDVERLAVSWPSLQYLNLDSHTGPLQLDSSRSLTALLSFATHCQQLKRLKLQIHAKYDGDYPRDLEGHSQIQLGAIDAASSPIDDPNFVASFLRKLFPKLMIVQSSTSDRQMTHKWGIVNDFLRNTLNTMTI